MIAAHELRIGNWLQRGGPRFWEQFDGKPFKVDIVMLNYINENSEGIEGIPLNSEILEKAGFKRDYVINEDEDETEFWYFGDFNLDYNMQPHDSGFPIAKYELNYFHQLQNLYFALTGEELKIDL